MKQKYLTLLSLIALIVFAGTSCKKIDLEKLPAVNTVDITKVDNQTANAKIEIIDFGDGTPIIQGVCYSNINMDPTVENSQFTPLVATLDGKTFEGNIGPLNTNTNYFVRAYFENSQDRAYGEVMEFSITGGGGGLPEWISYSNGNSIYGLSTTDTYYDVAIRFSPNQLSQYSGYYVTRISFYSFMDYPMSYEVEIFEGNGLANSNYIGGEEVLNPIVDGMTEVILAYPHLINTTKDLFIGVWVYNANPNDIAIGFDNGPVGSPEYSDLISFDDGMTWYSLYNDSGIDRNWNISAYIENSKGDIIKLSNNSLPIPIRPDLKDSSRGKAINKCEKYK